MGPLGGNCEVVHSITCQQNGSNVLLVDNVRVNRMFLHRRDDDDGGFFHSSSTIAMTMMRNKDDRLGDLEYPISPSSPTSPPQSSPTTPTQRTTSTDESIRRSACFCEAASWNGS